MIQKNTYVSPHIHDPQTLTSPYPMAYLPVRFANSVIGLDNKRRVIGRKVRETGESSMVCLSLCMTVRAVEIQWSGVINATALSSEDSMPPASVCKPPHTRAPMGQCVWQLIPSGPYTLCEEKQAQQNSQEVGRTVSARSSVYK